MDWKKTFNRGQWVIHGVFVICAVIAMGITIYSLRLYQLQDSEEQRILKVTELIGYLKQDQSFEKIGKYLSWAEADKADSKLNELSDKIAKLEEILLVKVNKDLSLSIRNFNGLVGNLSEVSRPEDALKVFNQKIKSLMEFSKAKSYKKIVIISTRMNERLSKLNTKNAGDSTQISNLTFDLSRMQQIVSSSALSDYEKTSLLDRFSSMKEELNLLSTLSNRSKDIKQLISLANQAMRQWILDVEKLSEGIKGQKITKQKNLVLMLVGLVGLMITSWIGLAYMFRWQSSLMFEQIENEVKQVIQKGIIEDQRYMIDHYSDRTRDEIIRLLDNLKLKLSLGNLLHEGLPFAGCMIDNNFRITWNNQLFLDQLYLSEEEVKSDSFNWDYIREYLNLDQDPIYEAMVNKIAGIYPVKVKQDDFTPSQPFEMYVTPITVNREDRVMVFFYPLISVKEAIAEQVSLARHPVEKFLDLWSREEINNDEMSVLEKNFRINDLNDLYIKFKGLFERVNEEKRECLIAIHELEKVNSNLNEMLKGLNENEEIKIARSRDELKVAGDLRNSFISSIEKSDSLLQINKSIMAQNDDLRSEAQKMLQINNDLLKKNRDSVEIFVQLDSVRTDYRKLKLELLEVKAKLISLNNSLFGQLPPLDENQQKLAIRYKDELARLDFNVVTLDKKLSQLDILVTKLQMMNDRSQSEQVSFNFQTSQKDHELRETILELQKSIGVDETRIIGHFKGLHTLLKEDIKRTDFGSDTALNVLKS